MNRPAALILAAGFSTRLGDFKPLVDLAGSSPLARVVGLFQAAGVARPLVVTGHRGPEVAAVARALGAATATNPDPAAGMFSSVVAGLAALDPGEAPAAWVLPVDIPLVRLGTLRILEEHWRQERPAVTIPTRGGRGGHPPLLDRRVWPGVLAHDGTQGLRGALAAWAAETARVPTGDQGVLMDLDTPDDLERLRVRAGREGVPDPAESRELATQVFRLPQRVWAHSQAVARVGLALAEALGWDQIRRDLVEAGGLLHDLAKGEPRHAEVAAQRLEAMGLDPVARAVRDHGDLGAPPDGRLEPRHLVYLADKCAQGDQLVHPESRYGTRLEQFRDNPEAVAAILAKRERCRATVATWERAAGRSLADLLDRMRP